MIQIASSPLPARASGEQRPALFRSGWEPDLNRAEHGLPGTLPGRGAVGDTSRISSAENLAKAGQQFESVFTGMMLKSMRAAQLANSLFDSKALDTFRDMQDQLTVKAMAEHTPLGIGKAMTDFLSRGAASEPTPAPQPDLNAQPPTP